MVKLILFLTFFLSHSLFAIEWNDLWLTKDQQAKKAFDLGDTKTAIELFEDPSWRATAEYKAGDFSASAQSFMSENSENGLYNYANSLAKLGKLPDAIEVYDKVIEMQPDAADAIYNRDLIKNLLEEQKDNQNESKSNQSSDEDKQGDASEEQTNGESQSSDSQQNENQSSNESDKDGNINQEETSQEDLEAIERELQKAQEEAVQNQEPQDLDQIMSAERRSEQEQEQAMEQWLRRISDDPGGLLRRKFRYQYQRQGFDQDGNQLWPDDGVQPW